MQRSIAMLYNCKMEMMVDRWQIKLFLIIELSIYFECCLCLCSCIDKFHVNFMVMVERGNHKFIIVNNQQNHGLKLIYYSRGVACGS